MGYDRGISHKIQLRFLDLSFRTAYAQAKERALAQAQVPLLTAGSLQVEARGAARFVYRYRYDGAGKRVTEYLGPEGEAATAEALERARAEIAEADALAQVSRDLRKLGLYATDASTAVAVAALFNAGLFGRGGVLVGTHAFGVLLNELGATLAALPRTEDVDFARAAPLEVTGLPPGGLLGLLRETGLPFHEVPSLERKAPATAFKVRGRPLKVDLLVPGGAHSSPRPVAVPELGAYAASLPHLKFLLQEPLPAVLLGRDRIVPIRVPQPGRFCLHKLALYSLRRGDSPKREKDLIQAVALAIALANGQSDLLNEALETMDRSLRSVARAGARQARELLDADYSEAATLLAPLA